MTEYRPIADLRSARIMISNDDGIGAGGIKILEKIARDLCDDVWVVAPSQEQSAASHSLTIRRPLRIRQHSERRYSVDGTPTDSVLLGVRHILTDKKPDLILSGINRGGNLGDDVTYSGTVAAAMEGALLGIRSIAFSQQMNGGQNKGWAVAEQWTAGIIRRLVTLGWPDDRLMNVNFPDILPEEVTGVEVTSQGRRKIGEEITERIDPRGEAYIWIGSDRREDTGLAGTDLNAVTQNRISITPLCADLTDRVLVDSLRDAFR